jgi:hypothetical protein
MVCFGAFGADISSLSTSPDFGSTHALKAPLAFESANTLAEIPNRVSEPVSFAPSLARSAFMEALPWNGSPQSPLNVPLPHPFDGLLASQEILLPACRS